MTEERLKELFEERVADLHAPDLGAAAWTAARRTRRRWTAAVAVAAVAVIAVTAGVLTVGRDGDPVDPVNTPQVLLPEAVADAVAEPGSDYRGAQTWWAPSVADEADLPELESLPYPPEISLAPGLPPHPAGVPAHAVYELSGDNPRPGRVVIVGHDGSTYSLDVGRLDPVTDEEGNALSPLTSESLAPDGEHVFFVQKSSLEVYDLTTGEWTTYDTVPWLAEQARWLSASEVWVPGELGRPDGVGTTYDVTGAGSGSSSLDLPRVWDTSDEPWGPIRSSRGDGAAQAMFLADEATGPDGRAMGGLDALAARVGPNEGEDVQLLVMPGLDDGRWKGCCPVIGWLDDRTVLLQSRSNTSRILAWRVGTADLRRVSRITGWESGQEVPVGSFADLR
ncbi:MULTISPECIES: hypothetical protein [unclassified Nocardioides]|uniref:hypothetical protein n=1 Tax=unclassified Nocardioides TaxID=2615069 RepID=UPI0006F91298|nr:MULTISPECIES: hypothetical protein [unclassified Nocardioides]KRA31307.1 hypothetical protein ASD81_17835 [Nocardioides sp. Root614]KRA87928.1 hypothetical protein ASD84_18110 [Nocardioides sp. Root682]